MARSQCCHLQEQLKVKNYSCLRAVSEDCVRVERVKAEKKNVTKENNHWL